MEHQALATSATIDERAAALSDPAQVLSDPGLAPEDQRAILASWASDAKTIPDAPALRQLDSGAVVRLADILLALKKIDQRVGNGDDDDDDDPPPLPAAAAVPPAIARTAAIAA
jgi:hypothetical protein